MELPPDLNLTPEQERTFRAVISPAQKKALPPELVPALRARIAEALGTDTVGGGVTIGKSQIGALDRCEGFFIASLLNEGPQFAYSFTTAIGAVLHRAIQSEIQTGGSGEAQEPAEQACASAISHLVENRKEFAEYWRETDRTTRDLFVERIAPMIETFRATFPPIKRMRSELAPSAEFKLKAEFLDGNVQLAGRPDLALGRLEPGFFSRVIIDHKTGAASSAQMEDLRLYALLQALGTKAQLPPFRVATYFAEGGTFQVEEVTEETLTHAADRAGRAARRAIEVLDGDDVRSLNPGPWCRWCPRAESCPQALTDLPETDGD